MNSDRMMLYTDQEGNLKGLPKFPPNKRVSIEFVVVELPTQEAIPKRRPAPDIAGKIKITGNIFDTASSENWNVV